MQNRICSRGFWGKVDRENPDRVHLLEHHLADVGACFEALLEQPTIRRRMARTAGLDDLDPTTAARLCVFAALHDIGKVNVGFQTRTRGASHTMDMVPVLAGEDNETAQSLFGAMGWWWDATETWDDREGETVCGLLLATLSHHGRPLQLEGGRAKRPRFWQRTAELDPQEYVARIGRLVREIWFADAFAPGGQPLPPAPEFQHHFLGLCNLADWIGSNERWFEYVDAPRDDYINVARERAGRAISDIGLNLSGQRAAFAGVPGFTDLFAVAGDANAIQRAAHDNTPIDTPLVIIESETGSGKTEAALWRFAEMYAAGLVDGLYFALPTRAAAVQIHGRVNDFVARLFPEGAAPETVLAVPGYLQAGDVAGHHLHDYQVWWDDHAADGHRWAAESPKRYLAAQIAVGTVDQALLGALKVKNAHLRTASLARNLLVVDEVHASDAYMTEILAALLDAHRQAGGYALLMSATLGSVARQRWLGESGDAGLAEAVAVDYPAVSAVGSGVRYAGENNQAKTVSMDRRPVMRSPEAVAQLALDAARAGAKVLVVRNTVNYAVSTWQAVAERAGDDLPTLLHHGRYAAGDRRLLDGRVEALLGKDNRPDGGCVVVGTQTLEQSLDIDADLLITDLCPADVLLQRIGRLHRHGDNDGSRPANYAAPQCIVLTPPGDDLSPLLDSGQDANGLGPHGYVYEDLRMLQATLQLVGEHPRWRIPEMNRRLVERATHPTALEDIEAMGDAWKEHGIRVKGGQIGDWQTARNAIIRRDKSFFEDNREVLFPTDEERIRTRLGDDRVDIAFDPPPASPFDAAPPIERIAVTLRWLAGVDVPETVEPVAADDDDGFEFRVGERRFRYDRLGLRRL